MANDDVEEDGTNAADDARSVDPKGLSTPSRESENGPAQARSAFPGRKGPGGAAWNPDVIARAIRLDATAVRKFAGLDTSAIARAIEFDTSAIARAAAGVDTSVFGKLTGLETVALAKAAGLDAGRMGGISGKAGAFAGLRDAGAINALGDPFGHLLKNVDLSGLTAARGATSIARR
jgi:hypothetical protein